MIVSQYLSESESMMDLLPFYLNEFWTVDYGWSTNPPP